MAANRAQIKIDKGLMNTWQAEWIVASGSAASIEMGSPTKLTASDGSVAGVVAAMVDGDGTVSQRFCGIAKSRSTDTATASGTVETWYPVPGVIYRGKALTAANADTQGEINALMGKRVVFDLTSNNWTIDTAAADALVNCVAICGGYPNTSEIIFVYSPKGTIADTSTTI